MLSNLILLLALPVRSVTSTITGLDEISCADTGSQYSLSMMQRNVFPKVQTKTAGTEEKLSLRDLGRVDKKKGLGPHSLPPTQICMDGRALPQHFLLGAQKSGTSSLADDMFTVGVRSADGRPSEWKQSADGNEFEKELHSFDKYCGFLSASKMTVEASAGKIPVGRCNMNASQVQEWIGLFNECTHTGPTLMDGTPANLMLLDLPVTLEAIYGPASKYLSFSVMLREPVSRTLSQHSMDFIKVPGRQMSFSHYLQTVRNRTKTHGVRLTDISSDYFMNPIYRSMYGVNLEPWLKAFKPSQFVVIPMHHYFASLENRRSTLEVMKDRLNIPLSPSKLQTESEKGNNPLTNIFGADLSAEDREYLRSQFFDEDLLRLSTHLAEWIPQGLQLAGYFGAIDPQEIATYLTANW